MRDPVGSEPGYRCPVVVVQSDFFNRGGIRTLIVVTFTSNTALADAPGNVLVSANESGLYKDSVANISQVATLDRTYLSECVGKLSDETMAEIAAGLRLVLAI